MPSETMYRRVRYKRFSREHNAMQAVLVVAGKESLLWPNSRIRKEFYMQMVLWALSEIDKEINSRGVSNYIVLDWQCTEGCYMPGHPAQAALCNSQEKKRESGKGSHNSSSPGATEEEDVEGDQLSWEEDGGPSCFFIAFQKGHHHQPSFLFR